MEMAEITKRQRKSCIFGCDSVDIHIHRFLHPINHHDLFSSWVAIVGDRLKDMIDPMKIYSTKRVCDCYFKPEEITAGRRVVFGAVPSLNLNGSSIYIWAPVHLRDHTYNLDSTLEISRPTELQSEELNKSIADNLVSSLEISKPIEIQSGEMNNSISSL